MFQKELDIVCADMRSSSYEAALTRFEARLNSPQLSDVVRGLIGVLRGDDGAVYFQMLTHDFKQAELQRLKAKAAKNPAENPCRFLLPCSYVSLQPILPSSAMRS